MKRLILAAGVAALALAGVLVAQAQPDTRSGPVYGYEAPQPAEPESHLPKYPGRTKEQIAAHKTAVAQFELACAADFHTFCQGDKSLQSNFECLKIRRSKLDLGCRDAIYAVERPG